jgi:hypothetical protein
VNIGIFSIEDVKRVSLSFIILSLKQEFLSEKNFTYGLDFHQKRFLREKIFFWKRNVICKRLFFREYFDEEDHFVWKKTFIRKTIFESILLEIFLISLFFKCFFINY